MRPMPSASWDDSGGGCDIDSVSTVVGVNGGGGGGGGVMITSSSKG